MRTTATTSALICVLALALNSCTNLSESDQNVSFTAPRGFDLAEVERAQNTGQIEGVLLKEQTWSKTNLHATALVDGTAIRECNSCDELIQAHRDEIPAYCYLDFDPANAHLGKLYNHFTVFHEAGIAPEGWRIPTAEDFIQLGEAYGMFTANDWGWQAYTFDTYSFKADDMPNRNSVDSGFGAHWLGSCEADFDCMVTPKVADLWTVSPDDAQYETNIYGDTLYARTETIYYMARFQDNTDQDLRFVTEGMYLLPAAERDCVMPMRLIKSN